MPQEHPELLRISDLPHMEGDYYGLAKPTCHGTSSEGGKTNPRSECSHRNIQMSLGNTWNLRGELGVRDISFVMCKSAGKNLK